MQLSRSLPLMVLAASFVACTGSALDSLEGVYASSGDDPLKHGPISVRRASDDPDAMCVAFDGMVYKVRIEEDDGTQVRGPLEIDGEPAEIEGVPLELSVTKGAAGIRITGIIEIGRQLGEVLPTTAYSQMLGVRYDLATTGETDPACDWLWPQVESIEQQSAECWVSGGTRVCGSQFWFAPVRVTGPAEPDAFRASARLNRLYELKELTIMAEFEGARFEPGAVFPGTVTYVAATATNTCRRLAAGTMTVTRALHNREACAHAPMGLSYREW